MSVLEMAKVTSKGQITIPVSIRRRLGIREGDKLLFIDSPDGVIMVNPDRLQGGRAAASQEIDVMESDFDDISALDLPLETASDAGIPAKPARPIDSGRVVETSAFSPSKADSASESPSPPRQPPAEPYSPPPTPPQPAAPAPAPLESETSLEPPGVSSKPGSQVKGVDIGALLDEIRSIGSKI